MNVLALICFYILLVNPVIADDDSPISVIPGSIFLSSQVQNLSGLQVTTLMPVNHQLEFICYGKVINLQALVELRHRYLVAKSEQGGASARFQQSEQNFQRQQDLFREGITSKRNLQAQQAQWQTDKALIEASTVLSKTIVDEALLNWGKKLTEWALSDDSNKLTTLLSGQKTLLLISLPVDKNLSNDLIYIEPSGERSKAYPAELISPAAQTDTTQQGESYFFQTDGGHLRTGMRVAAWIPDQNKSQSGVMIPKSAVIWYMDQAYVYIQTATEQFVRRSLNQYLLTAKGYFVTDNIQAGEQLVVTGGQMLLSEELRGQIPDEDN